MSSESLNATPLGSSELLKRIAAGEAFDLVEGVREIARVLVEQRLASASQDRPAIERTAKGKIATPRNGTPNP